MCPHDCFEILSYRKGILVRRCKSCMQIEVMTEHWADAQTIVGDLQMYYWCKVGISDTYQGTFPDANSI